MALKINKLAILENEIKNEMREYVKKIDWVVNEDPLGFLALIKEGYPSDNPKKLASPNRELRNGSKRLSTLITYYRNNEIGSVCNEIANHKDFDLLQVWKNYRLDDFSFTGNIQTLYLEYITKAFELSPRVYFSSKNAVFRVKNKDGKFEAVYCNLSDYRTTIVTEKTEDILHSLKLDIFIYSKLNEQPPTDFYSKYKLLYRKPILIELKRARTVYNDIISSCNRAPEALVRVLGESLNTAEYLFREFIEKDSKLIRPSIIGNLVSIIHTVISFGYNHKEFTSKSYNRLEDGVVVYSFGVVDMFTTTENLEVIIEKLNKIGKGKEKA